MQRKPTGDTRSKPGFAAPPGLPALFSVGPSDVIRVVRIDWPKLPSDQSRCRQNILRFERGQLGVLLCRPRWSLSTPRTGDNCSQIHRGWRQRPPVHLVSASVSPGGGLRRRFVVQALGLSINVTVKNVALLRSEAGFTNQITQHLFIGFIVRARSRNDILFDHD